MTNKIAQVDVSQGVQHANNQFIKCEEKMDEVIARLIQIRAAHFNVDPKLRRDWADVGTAASAVNSLVDAANRFATES